jgi:hypothetical protein
MLMQHWVKDMRHSTKIRDEEGYPAFALVNKVTGEALKHSTGQGHPVSPSSFLIQDTVHFFGLDGMESDQTLHDIIGMETQVKLVPYNPHSLDESLLWTESRDVGEGFRCIRMVNNVYLNFDAFHGDKAHGGVHDGTEVVLWEWAKGDNQRWKILPWCKFFPLPSLPLMPSLEFELVSHGFDFVCRDDDELKLLVLPGAVTY